MQREPLRELAQLVRYAEPGGTNIGSFVAEHASELAHLLQSDERELRAAVREPDGVLVDRLRARLELALDRERQHRAEQDVDRAHGAARELGRTARWFERGVVLDVDVLLGDLLADPRCRTVAFKLPTVTVCITTGVLRRARPLKRVYIDLACCVDETGLHLRWKGGRGALNFYPTKTVSDALVVQLPPPVRRQPELIGDVLAGIGFGG